MVAYSRHAAYVFDWNEGPCAAGSSLPPGEWVSTHEYACLEAVQHALWKRHGFDVAAADIYSIGVTLWELLTGEQPVRVPEPEDDEEPEGSCDKDDFDIDGGAEAQRSELVQLEALLLQRVRLLAQDGPGCPHHMHGTLS